MRLLAGTVAGVVLGVGVVSTSCGGGGGSGGAGGGNAASTGTHSDVCSPGVQGPCACAGGTMGVQTCSADGASFGPCQGCGGATTGTGGSSSASASSSGSGGSGGGASGYPAGPYALTKGSVVPDLALQGFADAVEEKTTVQSFSLGDFYDPGGSGVFPAGSPLGAGQAKPKALLLFFAGIWVEPANDEAKSVLPPKHLAYAPAGGQFVTILIDGPTPGTPATATNLLDWVTQYQVDYPSGIEVTPSSAGITAFPLNLIVDPRTMKVIDALDGEPVLGTCGNSSACAVDTDCQTCDGTTCGDGTACTTQTQCAGKTCTPYPFWSEYAALLGLDGG